jgi:hypothetical protein
VGGKGRWLWRWRFECDTEWNNKRTCTRHLMNGSSRPWRRDDISRAKRPMLEEACNTSYTLHVTRHTSLVTRHTSHITHHITWNTRASETANAAVSRTALTSTCITRHATRHVTVNHPHTT